jgi:hypothetical protein
VIGVPEVALQEVGTFATQITPAPEGAHVRLASDQDIERLLRVVQRAGGRLVSVNPVRESLEDLFVREVRENTQAKQAAS